MQHDWVASTLGHGEPMCSREIDEEMFCDEDEDYDESEDCGRWNNGHLTSQCRLAGSEWCDWSCPVGLPRRIANRR